MNRQYSVQIRGPVPEDLIERISLAHARAILHRPENASTEETTEPAEENPPGQENGPLEGVSP